LHGIARDINRDKMSKSKGNGVDPLDVVRLYGADALRYTLIAGMGLGTDITIDSSSLEKAFAPGRNFVTKLWNIGRHAVLAKLGDDPVQRIGEFPLHTLTRADAWILDRLDAAIAACGEALGPAHPLAHAPKMGVAQWSDNERQAGLRLNEYAESARAFIWNDLADWYVEHCKARLTPEWDRADREVARAVLVHVLDGGLRLLHPIVPYVTETLWQHLPTTDPGTFLATTRWPLVRDGVGHGRAGEYDRVRDAVRALNKIRADYAITNNRGLEVVIVPPSATRDIYVDEAMAIGRLTNAAVRVADHADSNGAATAVLADGATVIVPLAGVIDVDKECARLRTERDELAAQLDKLRARLGNDSFVSRAPAAVVDGERQKEREWTVRVGQLDEKVRGLCGA
jgi:valyl-tRNA synthetase